MTDARDLAWGPATRRKIIAAWLRVLRAKVTTDRPVRLGLDLPPIERRKPAGGDDADIARIVWGSRCYWLRFSSNLSRYETMDSVIHEYAHAVAGFGEGHDRDHGSRFGAALARCYRALVGD